MSSAYSAVKVSFGTAVGRSLMKSRESIDPNMLPCGAPDVICDYRHAASSIAKGYIELEI